MPNKRTGKNRSVKSLGDVTLNDFANSTVCNSRTKKSTSNVNKVLKTFEEEKTWDEKIDDLDESEFVAEVDEEGNVTYVIKKIEARRRRKTISTSEENKDIIGKNYPIDIWFLISEYIRPEDVGRFAAICKTSFEVTCTAKFWFSLYKRYYVSMPNIPEELQPESLVRKYRLKTFVIRALHYMYPPFVKKLTSISVTLEEHPDILKKRICSSHWFGKSKRQWVYYFKMREKTCARLTYPTKIKNNLPDLLEILDDVSANADEHCRVLQVVCKDFIQVPPVLGQVLMSVTVTLSQGFRYQRVQLGFGTGVSEVCNTTIILDPVISYRVLDWWHPSYPHHNNIQDLLCQD